MMKKLIWLACLVALIPKAHAGTCPISSGANSATIVSTIESCGSGNTVTFAAGSYTISATAAVPCGVSVAGPSVPWAKGDVYTALLTSTTTPMFSFAACSSSSPTRTIEYLSANGSRPSAGGGNILYFAPGQNNVLITHNFFWGNQGEINGGYSANFGLISLDGTSTSTADTNITISWNQLGQSGDCSNVIDNTGNDYGGACVGIGMHNPLSGVTINNNMISYQEQGIKFFEGEANGVAACANCVVTYNEINHIHRISVESQVPQTNQTVRYNSLHTQVYPYTGSWGLSLRNDCPTGVTSGCVTNADDNVLINDVDSTSSYTPGALEESGVTGTTGNYNLIQGYWAQGIMIAPDGQFTYNYDSFYLPTTAPASDDTPNGGAGCCYPPFNNESHPAYTASATGDTFTINSTGSGTVTSVAPTISPASGTFSGSQVVTITNPGTNRDTNTTDWCTTDGSTPSPGSGTAIGYYQGGSLTVTSTTTVKCVGMWGALNQPYSYPSTYGYVPSVVTSATYTGGGGTQSSLGNGTYEIESGSDSVDGGFGYYGYSGPQVQLYSTVNPPATLQEWIWNGSTFQNDGWAGHYMTDAGNGTVSEPTSGYDTWTVTPSGTGWIIRDNRTGNYLSNNGGSLAMSTTQTVWTLPGAVVNLAVGTYEFTVSGDSIDGGFGYYGYSGPQVQLYSTVSPPAALQEWVWNGSTLQNNGWSGHYMTDAGGTVSEPTSSYDTWTVTQSGSGWTIKDTRTGKYLTDSSGSLITSSTATVFTAVTE